MFRYTLIYCLLVLTTGLIAFAAMASSAPLSHPAVKAATVATKAAPVETGKAPVAPTESAAKPPAESGEPPRAAEVAGKKLSADPLEGIDLNRMKRSDRGYIQSFDDKTVFFTVNPEMQGYADALFDQYQVPAGAAVLINSRTGRLVTFAQQRMKRDAAGSEDVALDPTPPAASLFKIVTTAALMEEGGLPLTHETCYAGGSRRLVMQHLLDQLPSNHACVSLTTALGSSINAVFAKLSDRHLSRTLLQKVAGRFGFNHQMAFDVPFDASSADIPADRLERARTAAGFWHTHLSPLHAAVIAQSLAQGGAMLRPYVVDHVDALDGEVIYKAKTKYLGHTVSKETAEMMTKAMVYTTTRGTARKSFRDPHGRPFLPGIDVSGKTGTLTGQKPYRAYTWFVGMAPANNPEVAIAVLVVNDPKWRIKAPLMAAMLLKKYFESAGKGHS